MSQQLAEKRTNLIKQAQAIIPTNGTEMLPETRARFERMMFEAEQLQIRIEAESRSQSQAPSTGRPPRSQPGAGVESESAETRAFKNYLRDGVIDRSALREQRDLSTGNAGVLIAQDYFPVLLEARKAWGQLASEVAQKVTRNGEPMRVTGVDDTAQIATVIGESTTGNPVVVSESDPNFAGFISNVDFMTTGEIKISLAEVQDSYFNLDSFIRDAFGKRIARGLAKNIVTGTASGNFQSIISTAQLSYTSPVGNTGAPTYADLVSMYAALDPAYIDSASFLMNSQTRSLLLRETDSLGRPLFVPNVNSDNLGTILGLPVVISQYHPNVGPNSVGAVQLGSLKDAFTLRSAGEVSVLRLGERYADSGQLAYIGYFRAGGYASPVGKSIVNLVQAAS